MMQATDCLAGLWAAASALLVGVAITLLVWYAPVQTDLLALLPSTEQRPAAERAVWVMHDAVGNRAVFLVGHADPATARKAAGGFAELLRRSGAFSQVQFEVPTIDPRAFALLQSDFRFGLLAEADRKALAGGQFDVEQWLMQRLHNPLRVSVGGGIAQDPFGFFDNFIGSLPYRHVRLDLEGGLLVARSPENAGLHVLVTGELPGSAYDDRIQRRVLDSVKAAEKVAREAAPGVEVLRTGAVFFAAAARSSAEHDVDLIGAGSIAGIVLLMLAVFRTVRPLLLGLLTVAIGLSAAVSASILVHGKLHLLTLVFGASLIGEAIDYSIQYFGAYAEAGSQWDPQRGMLSVRPGLTLALLTSLLGYGALLFIPFPAVSQIALFAVSGLAAAYLSVVLLLPRVLREPYGRDISAITAPAARFIDGWRSRIGFGAAAATATVLAVLCVPGWLRLQWDDDVRALTSRDAPLLRQEAAIRAVTGLEIATKFFVVEGNSVESTLRIEEQLTDRLQELAASGQLSHYYAISSFVPSVARQQENHDLIGRAMGGDGKQLEHAFRQVGFRSGLGTELHRAYRESEGRALTPDTWLASQAATAFRHLWLGNSGGGYASVVVPVGASVSGVLAAAAAGLEGVSFVDKAASVSRLFAQYRRGFSYGLLAVVLVVLVVLSRRYGWSGGAVVLLPTLLAISAALALAGYSGLPVTLFSVMALMLVLGVGVNYAIFLVEGQGRGGAASIAVLLSAATTMLSFGLLAFSGTPALARFGSTLLAGVSIAVLLSPLALTFAFQRGVTARQPR
jgi:predicted exporter